MTDLRAEVHEGVDRINERQVAGLKMFLATYPRPLGAACRKAPEAEEPESEEEARLVAEALEWLRQNGGRGIPHEEIKRKFRLE